MLRATACPATALLRRPHPVPGKISHPAREGADVPGIRHPLMINGMPVVTAPTEIDVSTAGQEDVSW